MELYFQDDIGIWSDLDTILDNGDIYDKESKKVTINEMYEDET